MTRLLLFFLLLQFIFFHVEAVRLHISGTLTCDKPSFYVQVSIMEYDWFFDNDMVYQGVQHAAQFTHYYAYDVEYNEHDEAENDMYEIFAAIEHTCTDNGQNTYYESRIGYVIHANIDVSITHNLNITNRQGFLHAEDWKDSLQQHG